MKYIWLKIVKDAQGKWIEVGIDPINPDNYKCNCDDKRHLYNNKYPNFKCKSYKIAIEKCPEKESCELKKRNNQSQCNYLKKR